MVYILTLDMEEIPHEPKKKRGGQTGPKKQKQGQIRKGLTVAESDVNQIYQYWC